jgi:hypothetical protein
MPDVAWDTPLFMYESTVNQDIVLLPAAPSDKRIDSLASYKLVFPQPVVYGATVQSSIANISLKLYWSTDRKDLQTTDWDLDTLNQHGGNYISLGVIGWLCPDPAYVAPLPHNKEVPLVLTYSSTRQDAATSPFNSADLNSPTVNISRGGSGNFIESKQRIVGFGMRGSCLLCNTSLAAAYPSKGGADCPATCASGTSSEAFVYR